MQPPSDPSVFVIQGVSYYIDWDELEPGCSFFVKTAATANQVVTALRQVTRHLPYVLAVHNRCEYGYYGVRVWRLA